jgi:membrane-associated phospholipid phosphatase
LFQTELVIFVQSVASGFWTAFFKFFTEIGYVRWSIPLVLIILFGVNFRAGFLLIHALFWNGMATFYLKEWFALPRPCSVDKNVQLLGEGIPNPTLFENQGAAGFFEKLPSEAVNSFRANPFDSWGFPSGHTSNAVTQWGSIALIFKKTWVRIFAGIMLVGIPLSRMYLGRHFLADVLGGYLLGSVFVVLFYFGVYRSRWLAGFFASRWVRETLDVKTLLLLAYLLLVPLAVLVLAGFDRSALGALLGLNLGLLLLKIGGIPLDSGTWLQRLGRMLVAAVFYLGCDRGLAAFQHIFSLRSTEGLNFLKALLMTLLVLWASTEISIRLGFFKRQR